MILNKKVGLILPTRYHSDRLPGKVLIDINGKPNLQRIIERVSTSKYIDNIILAVSESDGNEIEEWARDKIDDKLKMFVGSHDNIFWRTLSAAKYYELDIICDISHDCTLVDFNIIDKLIDRLFEYSVDYSSNVITRTFCNGFDVQVYTREIYERVFNETVQWKHFYTGWNIFYTREKLKIKPKIINMEAESEYYYPQWHLCLDNEEDKIVIEEIFKAFPENYVMNYKEIVNFLKSNLDLLKINEHVKDTELLQEL
jgi:spore coat polysaccharide biosynthesis protein SpsF